MSGRQAEATRNDGRVLEAARAVLTADPRRRWPKSPVVPAAARRLHRAVATVIARAQDEGALRADVTQADVNLVFEQLRAVRVGDEQRTAALQRRYLALALHALRAPAAGPLPGPAPSWKEIQQRWQ
jgi:hypothetical protein